VKGCGRAGEAAYTGVWAHPRTVLGAPLDTLHAAASLAPMADRVSLDEALKMSHGEFLKRVQSIDDDVLEGVLRKFFNSVDVKRTMAQTELARRGREQQASTHRIARWTLIAAAVGVVVAVASLIAQCSR